MDKGIYKGVLAILPVLANMPNITHLTLEGSFNVNFNPYRNWIRITEFPYITHLQLGPFFVSRCRVSFAAEFLSMIPRLNFFQ